MDGLCSERNGGGDTVTDDKMPTGLGNSSEWMTEVGLSTPAPGAADGMGKAGGTTVGADSGGTGAGSGSSRLLGRTIRAKSFIFALRRKMPKGIRGGGAGALGGIILGVLTSETAGFKRKGDSLSGGTGELAATGTRGGVGAAGGIEVTGGADAPCAVGVTGTAGRRAMVSGFLNWEAGAPTATGLKTGNGGGISIDPREVGGIGVAGAGVGVAAGSGWGSGLIGKGPTVSVCAPTGT